MPSSSGSLDITLMLKSKCRFCVTLVILHSTLTKDVYFSKVCYHTKFQDYIKWH